MSSAIAVFQRPKYASILSSSCRADSVFDEGVVWIVYCFIEAIPWYQPATAHREFALLTRPRRKVRWSCRHPRAVIAGGKQSVIRLKSGNSLAICSNVLQADSLSARLCTKLRCFCHLRRCRMRCWHCQTSNRRPFCIQHPARRPSLSTCTASSKKERISRPWLPV